MVKKPVLGKFGDYCLTKWPESYTFIFFHTENQTERATLTLAKLTNIKVYLQSLFLNPLPSETILTYKIIQYFLLSETDVVSMPRVTRAKLLMLPIFLKC